MARLRRISTGGILALAINALLALTALGIAFGAPGGGDEPRLKLAAAGGSLTLVNSKEGEAIFTAGAMRPGEQTTGTVQITNGGSVAGTLSVARAADAHETPGAGGGLLTSRLELRVIDVTQASAPVELWSGKLAAMPTLAVGTIDAGGQRAYRFEATMAPDAGDNAFQGARLDWGYAWSAVGSDGSGATPTPTPTPSATATPDPVTPTTPATPSTPDTPGLSGVEGTVESGGLEAQLGAQLFPLPSAGRCLSNRKFTIRIRRPRGTTFKSLKISVNRRTRVKLTGLKARKVKARINLRGVPKGKVTVKIVAVTTTGRRAVSQRTYRTCTKKVAKKHTKKRATKRTRG